jgi:hypothetical protein
LAGNAILDDEEKIAQPADKRSQNGPQQGKTSDQPRHRRSPSRFTSRDFDPSTNRAVFLKTWSSPTVKLQICARAKTEDRAMSQAVDTKLRQGKQPFDVIQAKKQESGR